VKRKKKNKYHNNSSLISTSGNDKETLVLWQNECQEQSTKANLAFGKNFLKKREKWIRIAKELTLWLEENSGSTEGERKHAIARIAKIRKDYAIGDAEFERMEANARFVDPNDEPADDGGVYTKFYAKLAFSLPRPFQCLVNSITKAFGVAWYYTFWTLPHSKFPEKYTLAKNVKKGVEVHIYGAKECAQFASDALWRIAHTHSELVRKYKPEWFSSKPGHDMRTPSQKALFTRQKRKDYSLGLAHGFRSLCNAEEAKAKVAAEEAERQRVADEERTSGWDTETTSQSWKAKDTSWEGLDLTGDGSEGESFGQGQDTLGGIENSGTIEDPIKPKQVKEKHQKDRLQQTAIALISRKKIEIVEDFKKKHLPKLFKGRKSKANFNTRSLSYVIGKKDGTSGKCGKLDAVKCYGKK